MNSKYKSFLLILVAAILGGGVGVLAKIGLKEIEPIPFTFLRFLFTLIVLLPVFYYQKHRFTLQNFKKMFWVCFFGAGNIFVFIYGIRLTTASSSQVIYSFSPLIAGIVSYLLFKERLGKRKIWGILIGFVGTLIVILLPAINGGSGVNGNIWGNLLILLAVFSHSVYSVLSKEKQRDFSPLVMTVYSVTFTFIISLILLPFNFNGFSGHIPSSSAILSAVYVGVLGTAAYYLIYQNAIKRTSAVVATTVLYLQPVFTFVWAAALLGERLTSGLIMGTVLAFVGVFLAATKGKLNTNE